MKSFTLLYVGWLAPLFGVRPGMPTMDFLLSMTRGGVFWWWWGLTLKNMWLKSESFGETTDPMRTLFTHWLITFNCLRMKRNSGNLIWLRKPSQKQRKCGTTSSPADLPGSESLGKTALECSCGNLGNWSKAMWTHFRPFGSILREDYTALLFHANRTQSCEYRPVHLLSGFGQIISETGWNHINFI